MVVKKIVQICKKTGVLNIYDDTERGIQWIGNGYSVYPLEQMPYFSPETICRAYDISEKQAEKIRFTHRKGLLEGEQDDA